MKILIIHNKYLLSGGEDTVFDAESILLQQNGHDVQKLIYDNKSINTLKAKVMTGLMTLFNFSTARDLRQKIHTFQPDIIHVHNFFPIASPSIFLTAYRYKIPIILTLHNYRLICPNALLYRDQTVCEQCIHQKFALDGVRHGCYRQSRFQTFILATMSWAHTILKTWQQKITLFIALTHFEKNKFLNSSLSLKENQIKIKPNFGQDHGYDFQKKDYYIYVGRLSSEKGIDILLETFKNSKQKLFIIGTGPLEKKVQESSHNHPNIIWLGFQTKETVIHYLKYAKALIFSSVCFETFGMTIIEAFSTATPVICSDHGVPSELVKPMQTGLHFRTGDSVDLQQKIDWMNTHPDQHHKLCINARHEYEAKYTPDKNYEIIMKIYKEAIRDKKTCS